jgi:hypothetical protein
MTPHDDSPLTTERVASSRRGPLTVALGAAALVALLVWKPWVGPTAALPSPSSVSARPTPSPPTPSPTPPPTPGPTPAVANVDVDWIYPFVECGYEPGPHGASVLSTITLWPPSVVLHPDGIGEPVTQVRWRALVESNLEQTLFSAAWDRVTASRWRPALDRVNTDTTLGAIDIGYTKGPVGPTVVVRVEVVAEWLGPGGLLRGSASVVPTSYRHAAAGAILPEGCHTVT